MKATFAASFLLLQAAILPPLSRAQDNSPLISDDQIIELTLSQTRNYLAGFQQPDTGVLYGARLSGKAAWTPPAEILQEKPKPWGYGSRIADTVLHTGHMLVALLDAHAARPDRFLEEQIRIHFEALRFIGSLPENHPKPDKPALSGLVPRGPHPDDPSAYFDDSSMDQHTTYIISLGLFANSPLATEADKQWIRESLGKVGRRLEKYNWSIKRADGVTANFTSILCGIASGKTSPGTTPNCMEPKPPGKNSVPICSTTRRPAWRHSPMFAFLSADTTWCC